MGKIVYCIVFLFCTTLSSIAQTYAEDENQITIDVTSEEDAQIPVLFQSLGIDNSINPQNTLIGEESQVFLRQIGDLNIATINVRASQSDIILLQSGNGNDVLLDYNVNTVFTDIMQNGDDNNILDFITNPTENVSLDLRQNGNNLNFERIGSNSLTRSLRFVQTQASPSWIIRSFN